MGKAWNKIKDAFTNEKRQTAREEKRKLRRNGPTQAYYGGSKEAFDELLQEAKDRNAVAGNMYQDAYGSIDAAQVQLADRYNYEHNREKAALNEAARRRTDALESRDTYKGSISSINQSALAGMQLRGAALQQNDMRQAVAANNAIRNNALASTNLERSAASANSIADSYLNRVDLAGAADSAIGMRNSALAATNLRNDASNANRIADSYLSRVDLRGEASSANRMLDSYLARTDLEGSAASANAIRTAALNAGRDLNGVASQANAERTAALNQINLEQRAGAANQQRTNTLNSLDYDKGASGAASLRDAALGRTDLERSAATGQDTLMGGEATANALRDTALSDSNILDAADQAITKNDLLAQERLMQQTGLLSRSARGLAGSMGEGGALAMQQAIASSGVAAADLAAQDQNTRAQLANDTRYAAARQRSQDILGTADAKAQTAYMSAQDRADLGYQGAYDQAGNILSVADANAGDLMTANLNMNAARQNIGEAQAQQSYLGASEQAANNIGVANMNANTTYQGAYDQNANILSVGDANANTAYQGARDQAGNVLAVGMSNADRSYGAAADQMNANITVGMSNADRSYQGSRDQVSNQLTTADANANQYYGARNDQMLANINVGNANASRAYQGASDQAANILNTANYNASDYLQGYGMQATNALNVANANAADWQNSNLNTVQAYNTLWGNDQSAYQNAEQKQQYYSGLASGTATNQGSLALQQAGIAGNYATGQQNYLGGLYSQQLAADTYKHQKDYENAVKSNPFQKIISTAFDPMDIRGSGAKGYGL